MSFLIWFSFLYSTSSWGRSLKATADKLGSDMANLGIAIGIFALVLAGIWLMLGKQDAGTKFTNAITGLIVVGSVVQIHKFVIGVT